ncbi:Detected protein of confused Function [Hibiscus syriacus]|uniref:Detected protein of confused Function n=1 Tax=Hibiscus syriacus TaxID=106335 RepID=A0A6A2ZQW1_HIBSY|nr:Detected protein of confused Function [Hibiscus syriacus]
MPAFWDIIVKARKEGLGLSSISSHGTYCIQGSDLVLGASEGVYLELMLFLAENWKNVFDGTTINNIPILKYLDIYGCVSLCSNQEFSGVTNRVFLPETTQTAILTLSKQETILEWLQNQANVDSLSVYTYAAALIDQLGLAEVDHLCGIMPLVDNYGTIVYANKKRKILVPAKGSKWNNLVAFILLKSGTTPGGQLLKFLRSHVAFLDITSLPPPNVAIPAASLMLTKENTFLLLDWIIHEKKKNSYSKSVSDKHKEWKLLRVTINGSSGYKPPEQSFFYSSSWGDILQNGSVFVDIPLIDQSFYGERISHYREELQTIVSYHVLSVLGLIKYLRTKYLPPDEFIRSIKEGRWLKTSCGYRSSIGTILYDEEWKIAIQLCDLPLIDQAFYGDEIFCFKEELRLLGVIVGFSGYHQLVIDNLKQSARSLKADAFIFLLECMRNSKQPNRLVSTLGGASCLKTNLDYKHLSECFLFDQQCGCLLQVFSCFSIIEHSFYGSNIFFYKNELKTLSVVVDFEVAIKSFIAASGKWHLYHLLQKITLSFLSCCRQLKGTTYEFPSDLKKCILEVKWLRTRLGDFRSPRECIIFSPEWESISSISQLPFIDDSYNYYGKDIHKYSHELESIGVVVEFERANDLDNHSDFATIIRIYKFLAKAEQLPDSKAKQLIWIPDGNEHGRWVDLDERALHDKDGLFRLQLIILDKHYKNKVPL